MQEADYTTKDDNDIEKEKDVVMEKSQENTNKKKQKKNLSQRTHFKHQPPQKLDIKQGIYFPKLYNQKEDQTKVDAYVQRYYLHSPQPKRTSYQTKLQNKWKQSQIEKQSKNPKSTRNKPQNRGNKRTLQACSKRNPKTKENNLEKSPANQLIQTVHENGNP